MWRSIFKPRPEAELELERQRTLWLLDLVVGTVYCIPMMAALMELQGYWVNVFWGASVPAMAGACTAYLIKWAMFENGEGIRERYSLYSFSYSIFGLCSSRRRLSTISVK